MKITVALAQLYHHDHRLPKTNLNINYKLKNLMCSKLNKNIH